MRWREEMRRGVEETRCGERRRKGRADGWSGREGGCLFLRLRFPELVDQLLQRLHLLLVHLRERKEG
jgi:hypothetical protein